MNMRDKPVNFHSSMLSAWSAFSDEFIAVWDESKEQLLYFNDAYVHFFGVKQRDDFLKEFDFLGFRKHELTHDIKSLVKDTIQKNGLWKEEVLFKKKTGEVYLGRLDIAAFTFEENTHYLQRIINIDNQRLFSENLFKEIKKFEALFQYATLPILLVNKLGSIILANNQALTLFGYTEAQMSVLKVEDLIPKEYRPGHTTHRSDYEKNPQTRPMGRGMELFALKKSGEKFPVEVSLGHYQIEDETYVISFIIDITRRLEIEGALRKQTAEMENAKKEIEKWNEELENKVDLRTHELMDTLTKLEKSRDELTTALSKEKELSDLKSRFVSIASHEFRTPLSTILSSVSLISKYTQSEDQDKRDKHIQRIHSAVSNLTDILNEFLSLGKIEEGKIQVHFTSFNLKEQLKLIVNEIANILKPGQEINYEHLGEAQVNLDLSLLRNIIINLISNASKFSPENSIIKIKSEVSEKSISLTIQDKGIGIPEEDQKHLFERFFRAKNVTNIQGTGLGLHIVSRYVELMNGSISVESVLEEGSTITIQFNI
jgi:PAS domain S-box-containing protein